jgi:hypothetical protein
VSSTAFAQESLSSHSLKTGGSTLRVNRPGDAHEVEADHVAERVSRGDRIASWSLRTVSTNAVQRDPDPAPAKQPSTSDIIGKAAEALLATKAGQAAVAAIKKDPVVKSTSDFLATPAGIVIAGTAATAVVTGLAVGHKPLPLQLPKIPLDFVHPGLSMKLSYQGPIDRPTAAFVTLSFTPKAHKEKKADAGGSLREEINQLRAQQEMFGGASGASSRPGPLAHPADTKSADPAAKTQPPKAAPKDVAAPVADAAHQSAPKAADTTGSKKDKHEETMVQRKAEPLAETQPASTSSVREVLHDSGRPLDRRTRGYMESRFGVDFGNVRIHTGDRAEQSARNLNARAYTVGSDVVFSSGKYAPETSSGRKLLAHELTHVVQQSPGAARKAAGVSASPRRVQRSEGSFTDRMLAKVRSLPGYDLFCTIIGKDITTWQDKPSKKEDILREVVKLIGGEEAYERLTKAAGAIEKAWEWFKGELVARHLTLEDFKSLIDQAKASVSVGDVVMRWGETVERIKAMFRPAYESAVDLAKVAFRKFFELVVEVVMDNFGDTGKQVMGYLRKAGETIVTIARDPIKFVGNLVNAMILGFKNFAGNFLPHLKNSLMDFVFGEAASRIKQWPKEFSLSAIFSLVLDVLDLNYAAFRERLVAKTSPEAVTFLEGAVDTISKMVQAKSLSAAWDVFKKQAGDLIGELVNSAIEKIKNWVVTNVVQKAITKVLQLFTPASAVIAAIETIYHTIVTLIQKGQQLLAVLNAAVDSIARIAAGDLTQAAEKIEAAMATGLNFIVAFFAEQAGVGGIGQTIRDFIKAVKDKVWSVIDKVIDFVVGKAKGLWERAKTTAGKVLSWWRQRDDFIAEDKERSIYMEGSEEAPQLLVASSPGVPWSQYLADRENAMTAKQKGAKKGLLQKAKDLATKLQDPLKPSSDDKEKAKKVEAKRKDFNDFSKTVKAIGFGDDADGPAPDIKYDPPRSDGGGTKMTAKILSRNHPEGSPVADDPPIWKNLTDDLHHGSGGSYVQGHFLNNNLGGAGRRFNLSPITNSANQTHLNAIEQTLKDLVNPPNSKVVVRYMVKAVYPDQDGGSKHPISARYDELRHPKKPLTTEEKKEKAMYDAEQKLCNRFEWKAAQLKRKDGKWVDDKPINGGEGKIENNPK